MIKFNINKRLLLSNKKKWYIRPMKEMVVYKA